MAHCSTLNTIIICSSRVKVRLLLVLFLYQSRALGGARVLVECRVGAAGCSGGDGDRGAGGGLGGCGAGGSSGAEERVLESFGGALGSMRCASGAGSPACRAGTARLGALKGNRLASAWAASFRSLPEWAKSSSADDLRMIYVSRMICRSFRKFTSKSIYYCDRSWSARS